MADNMRIYSAGRSVPSNAIKKITGGAYGAAGLSDINPQWRIEKLTEIFGPCGEGWGWEPISVDWNNGCVYAHIGLWHRLPDGSKSELVHGFGGTKQSGKDDSDIIKSSCTDAVSNAARYLGIGADVWWSAGKGGQYDTKYSTAQRKDPKPKPEPNPAPKPAPVTPIKKDLFCEGCGRLIDDPDGTWEGRSRGACDGLLLCKACGIKYKADRIAMLKEMEG